MTIENTHCLLYCTHKYILLFCKFLVNLNFTNTMQLYQCVTASIIVNLDSVSLHHSYTFSVWHYILLGKISAENFEINARQVERRSSALIRFKKKWFDPFLLLSKCVNQIEISNKVVIHKQLRMNVTVSILWWNKIVHDIQHTLINFSLINIPVTSNMPVMSVAFIATITNIKPVVPVTLITIPVTTTLLNLEH